MVYILFYTENFKSPSDTIRLLFFIKAYQANGVTETRTPISI